MSKLNSYDFCSTNKISTHLVFFIVKIYHFFRSKKKIKFGEREKKKRMYVFLNSIHIKRVIKRGINHREDTVNKKHKMEVYIDNN